MSSLPLLQSSTFAFSFGPFTSKTLKRPIPVRLQPISSRHVINNNKDDYKALNSFTASDKQLPAVRSYENDLCSLTLVGSVDFEQALTAAAADGGETADEHLASNLETMVVETVFPGGYDDRSTVSTRLFLPVKKVKEKATKLRSSLTADILSSSSVPKNILAMTFRQVILHHLWSYKLSIFCPGTEKDMKHLDNPREIQIKFCISSSDKLFLSKLSEVVCSWALENTKMSYLKNINNSSNGIFDWLKKSLGFSAVDSSICVCRLSQTEIENGAKKRFEKFYLAKEKSFCGKQHKCNLLEPPNFSQLEKVAGAGFGEWAKEFVPAYRLQVDGNLFKDIKLEGLQEMSNNRWEALLTHTQMDKLVHILDMYFEDRYTLPDKELSCGLVVETSITTKKFMWKLLIGSIAGVCFLIITAVFAQMYWPNLLKTRGVSDQNSSLPLFESYTDFKSLKTAEVKPLCVSVIQKIKDELGLPGDIMVDEKCGAWIGTLPTYLKELIYNDREQIENSTSVDSLVQDIASYQVVMSGDGTVVGFQPTSRVAVNHWASNPLAKVLYGGRQISPGVIEPSLKIPHPSEVAVIEVLMSVNSKPSFVLARPMQ